MPELVLAPELAAICLLEHTLKVTARALLAEHPTLIDDFARARDDGRVVASAYAVCRRVAALEHALRRYRRAVSDAVGQTPPHDDARDDLPF